MEYAARGKEFLKKRILLTFLLQLKVRGNSRQKIKIFKSFKCKHVKNFPWNIVARTNKNLANCVPITKLTSK